MGCAASRIEKGENVQRCGERKRLMKQLVGLRCEFAAAQMAYLRALRNVGATLRQFTEPETLVLENAHHRVPLPPSPLHPLPPSPPPPPSFSPDLRRVTEVGAVGGQCMDINEDNSFNTPPPPVQSTMWDFWDPLGPSPVSQKTDGGTQEDKDEVWADTKTEFEEENDDEVKEVVMAPLPDKSASTEMMDDTSSMTSWYTKDVDMAMVVWKSQKTLAGIMKELDDYFLQASAGVKEIAILMDTNGQNQLPQNVVESKRRSCKSAKVFSALSWSRSSKSLLSGRESIKLRISGEACKAGAPSAILDKLYAEEQKLYEKVKKERLAQLRYEKQISLLQKLEAGEHDVIKAERARSSIESLQAEMSFLQECISSTCSCILKLRDEELHPQLILLSSRLNQIWRTMYECHQVQNHIAQQMNDVGRDPNVEPTSDGHIHATIQLESEVTSWYNSFCSLLKSQHDYVRMLNKWVQLTSCMPDSQPSGSISGIHALCQEWQIAVERLPDKVPADALKSFVSVIHSIVLQQAEEHKRQLKSDKLQRMLDRELSLLRKMENTWSENTNDNNSSPPTPNHALLLKRAKTEALRKKAEDEKARHLNSVRLSHAMTLNSLNTCLPNVFQALMGFSNVCARAFEAIHTFSKTTDCPDGVWQPHM